MFFFSLAKIDPPKNTLKVLYNISETQVMEKFGLFLKRMILSIVLGAMV
jgi:hypothetical protein